MMATNRAAKQVQGEERVKRMHKASALLLIALLLGVSLAGCGTAVPSSAPAPTTAPGAAGPTTAQEFFEAGNGHAQAGEFEEAVAAYQAALELEPDHVSAMINLGVAYYNLQQLDQAIAEYQKALRVAPEDEAIHSNLAAAYVQQGKLEEALAAYTRALELEPTLSQAHFGLGVVYMQMGENEDAIEAFENFQKYDSGDDAMATTQAEEYLTQLRGQ
jgi:tetratricopeptide (TPR) repeat protein